MKLRPVEADHCSQAPGRRSGDGYQGHGCPSVEKHNVFVGFLKVHRMGLGAGAGAGLTEVAEAARQRLQHPAAAAVGSKQCGRSQQGEPGRRRRGQASLVVRHG